MSRKFWGLDRYISPRVTIEETMKGTIVDEILEVYEEDTTATIIVDFCIRTEPRNLMDPEEGA